MGETDTKFSQKHVVVVPPSALSRLVFEVEPDRLGDLPQSHS